MFQFHPAVSVRRLVTAIFSLLYRRYPSCIEAALYGLILPSGHKKTELKILFIKFVVRVICFCRGYDFSVRILECPGNNTLIYGITTGQTFYFHNKNTVPHTRFHFLQEALHHGPGRYCFAGYYFPVNGSNVAAAAFGKVKQDSFMPGQGFLLAACFGLPICTGLS